MQCARGRILDWHEAVLIIVDGFGVLSPGGVEPPGVGIKAKLLTQNLAVTLISLKPDAVALLGDDPIQQTDFLQVVRVRAKDPSILDLELSFKLG